ncbi:proline--tRNA ligase [[Eubacterium] cellulosolvens]
MVSDDVSTAKNQPVSFQASLEEKMKVSLDKSDFNEWYANVVELANLTDKRYPIKGMNVWTPYGWKVMRLIDDLIRDEMESSGHGEVCFPLLISSDQFAKEAEHIKGFDKEVYWVTTAGGEELDVKLLLRPTSETAMYPIFSLWVRSHSDLPLKTFQLVNTFRYDTKQTRAFIRVREIHFFEAHTCHADFEDAERQIAEDLEIMDRLARKLCLAHLLLKRPDWDKFPGAFYSLAADSYLPSGKTLQIGTIHQYRDNFSKPYDIKYEAVDGEHKYVHQTTYGMSERLIGAVVGVHGDNKGVILPPAIAPYQVVLVPILVKKSKAEVTEACEKLIDDLKARGVRVHFDTRDIRPGSKYYDWELRGVPVRLELGPRDLANDQVVAVRRDTGEHINLDRGEIVASVKQLLDKVSAALWVKSEKLIQDSILNLDSVYEAKNVSGIVRIGWCGEPECDDLIVKHLDMNMLGTPIKDEGYSGNCGQCGKPTKQVAYYAKTY